MKIGKWLEPRYTSRDIFEKDYPRLELSGIDIQCPGCKSRVTLNRKSINNKSAGWCKNCNRAVRV